MTRHTVFFSLLALPATLTACMVPGHLSSAPASMNSPTLAEPAAVPALTVTPPNSHTMILLSPEAAAESAGSPYPYPDLWTYIDHRHITLYPYNSFTDYLYASNGDLWLIGGFGAIRQRPDGTRSWYSIQNGLPVNYFQAIAVAPNGEVWIGGANNSLFRFDGLAWHDEGQFLPPPDKANLWWTCSSSNIFGIDFDRNGQIWVANGGINLYTQQGGHWLDSGFPKDLLPVAGGGGCPIGLRVLDSRHISIVRNGCCAMPPVAYHYNGLVWSEDNDVSEFVTHIAARRRDGQAQPYQTGSLENTVISWPFPAQRILPKHLHPQDRAGNPLPYQPRFGGNLLTFDETGTLWISNQETVFNNAAGAFQDLSVLLNGPLFTPDFSQAKWLDFPADPMIVDGPRRFMHFSRWFFSTELGNEIGPTLSAQAPFWNHPWLYFARDEASRVWFYLPTRGLVMADRGTLTVFPGPLDLTLPLLGGVQPLSDGRILIGTAGGFWVFDRGTWQKQVFPDTDEIFWLFAQDSKGVLYAATDTTVYQIINNHYTRQRFVDQNAKPIVRPHDPSQPPAYHKRYIEAGFHFEEVQKNEWPLHYYALLLRVLPDGTVLYANSHVLAHFDGQIWRSFLFDQITFESVAVDPIGNLWAYAGYNGLLEFAASIFQDYRVLSSP